MYTVFSTVCDFFDDILTTKNVPFAYINWLFTVFISSHCLHISMQEALLLQGFSSFFSCFWTIFGFFGGLGGDLVHRVPFAYAFGSFCLHKSFIAAWTVAVRGISCDLALHFGLSWKRVDFWEGMWYCQYNSNESVGGNTKNDNTDFHWLGMDSFRSTNCPEHYETHIITLKLYFDCLWCSSVLLNHWVTGVTYCGGPYH